MSSTAFIEPLPVIDFVTQLLTRDVSSRPLSDADRVKVCPHFFVQFEFCMLLLFFQLMKLGWPFCKIIDPDFSIGHLIPEYYQLFNLSPFLLYSYRTWQFMIL